MIVGATRILRPAVEVLVARGSPVVALARTQSDLDQLRASHPDAIDTVAVDYTDSKDLADMLAGPYLAGLIYAPHADERTWAVLRRHVHGPVVEIVTSAAAAPADGEPFELAMVASPEPQRHRLLLGWRPDGAWHSPGEVSSAAVDVLVSRRDAQLGSVRPWSARPG